MMPTDGRYEAHRVQHLWAWLKLQDRFGLWDAAGRVPGAKVFVPLNGIGRQWSSARWALGQQHRMDAAGMAHRRGGLAIELSPSDAARYGPILRDEHVEVFTRATLEDLSRPEALQDPTPTNGQIPAVRPEGTNGTRTRARGFRLPSDLLDQLDHHCEQTEQRPQQVVERLLRTFLQA